MLFSSREIPSRKTPWYLNPVPCDPVKSQSRPNFPFNPVMVQSRPIKTPSYSVPGNPGISRSRGISCPDENSVPRKALEILSTEDTLFRSATASLIFLSRGTRPDLAHAVLVLTRSMSTPGATAMTRMKRGLRYQKMIFQLD